MQNQIRDSKELHVTRVSGIHFTNEIDPGERQVN